MVAAGHGDDALEHFLVAAHECLQFQIWVILGILFFGFAVDNSDARGDKGFGGENLLNRDAFASVREEEDIAVVFFKAKDVDETPDGTQVCLGDVWNLLIGDVGVRPEDAKPAFAPRRRLHGGCRHFAGKRDVVRRERRNRRHIRKNHQIIQRKHRELPVLFFFGCARFALMFVL